MTLSDNRYKDYQVDSAQREPGWALRRLQRQQGRRHSFDDDRGLGGLAAGGAAFFGMNLTAQRIGAYVADDANNVKVDLPRVVLSFTLERSG